MDASRMVERCKQAQERMDPEEQDAPLMELLRSQGLRCRGEEARASESVYSLAPEREEREIIPLEDPNRMDPDCYGV